MDRSIRFPCLKWIHNPMFDLKISRRFWLARSLGVATLITLSACGGGEDYWDEFLPRAATQTDLANQRFEFRDFAYGAVFDPTLSTTPTQLAFSSATPLGEGWRLPFSVTARGAISQGTAALSGDQLTLQFETIDSALPFSVAKPIGLRVTADVDDGRIQLLNTETGVSQTSAPR